MIMMQRDAYYAERRIRKAREWEIQQQQSQSGNNVGAVLPLPKMGKGAIVVVSANSYHHQIKVHPLVVCPHPTRMRGREEIRQWRDK